MPPRDAGDYAEQPPLRCNRVVVRLLDGIQSAL
jgi:hypothetical protein